MQFGVLAKIEKYYVGISVVSLDDKYYALGSCANENLDDLIEYLIKEVVVNVHPWINGEFISINNLNTDAKPMDHYYFHLINSNSPLKNFISNEPFKPSNLYSEKKFSTQYFDLTSENSLAIKSSYYSIRAEAPMSQNLYFGPTIESKINLKRLKSIVGNNLSIRDLNFFPHPLP